MCEQLTTQAKSSRDPKARFEELYEGMLANTDALADLWSDLGLNELARAQREVVVALRHEGDKLRLAIADE